VTQVVTELVTAWEVFSADLIAFTIHAVEAVVVALVAIVIAACSGSAWPPGCFGHGPTPTSPPSPPTPCWSASTHWRQL
jgi:hypothetical protein